MYESGFLLYKKLWFAVTVFASITVELFLLSGVKCQCWSDPPHLITFPLMLTSDPPPSCHKRPIYRDVLNGTKRLGLKKLTLKTLLSLFLLSVRKSMGQTKLSERSFLGCTLCLLVSGSHFVYFHFVFKAEWREISVNNITSDQFP